jgi:hypothetical protein
MTRPAGLLIVVTLLLAAGAQAATSLEAARTEARQARVQVNAIRARQMELRSELNQVATRIEALKAQSKARSGELDGALRRSQELSSLLTTAAQQLRQAEGDSERGHLALLMVLSAELEAVRAQWDRTPDRTARASLLARMRALRAERDQVRSILPVAKLPALESGGSDDPADLLEQADALRDAEDKVRHQMIAVRARITELRQEQELDRRMSDFIGDESLFDDQDRRIRRMQSRTLTSGSSPPLEGGISVDATPEAAHTFDPQGARAPDTGSEGDWSRSTTLTQVSRGTDGSPQLGGQKLLLPEVDASNLGALQAELKKLERLARQLDERAAAIEKRAREP